MNGKVGVYKNFFKRLIDIIGSLLALIILSPLLLIVVALVKLNIGSPVIFKQERPGLNEKVFTIYKFRTMTNKINSQGELLPDHERITKFGHFLRMTSIDELPQLLNILKGDMSFIGPRPLLQTHLLLFNKEQRRRHEVRPGLSGLAQINGRNQLTLNETVKLDLDYVNHITLSRDFKILILTILIVLKRENIDYHPNRVEGNLYKDTLKKND